MLTPKELLERSLKNLFLRSSGSKERHGETELVQRPPKTKAKLRVWWTLFTS